MTYALLDGHAAIVARWVMIVLWLTITIAAALTSGRYRSRAHDGHASIHAGIGVIAASLAFNTWTVIVKDEATFPFNAASALMGVGQLVLLLGYLRVTTRRPWDSL